MESSFVSRLEVYWQGLVSGNDRIAAWPESI